MGVIFKNIEIDRRDSWKYSDVLSSGDSCQARMKVLEDGSYDINSYSKKYREESGMIDPKERKKQKAKKDKKEKKSKSSKSSDKSDKEEGCLMKIIKAPFRLLWWIIKRVLIILSLGMLSAWLNDE